MAHIALDMLGLDMLGLDDGDRRILKVIVELFDGGPVGLSTIAAAINEEAQTIEDIYEPYLIQQGFLERTARGRRATKIAYDYLKVPYPRWKTEELHLFPSADETSLSET
jgi:Holliday junction DNA helicase RuvB